MTTVLSLAFLLAPAAVRAQDDTEVIESAPDPWTIKFEPVGWYVAPNGDIRLPGSTGAGRGASFTVAELNIDSPRLSPLGEFQLRRGDWRITVQGLGFSLDDRASTFSGSGQIGGAPFAAGDTLQTSLDLFTFSVDGAYALRSVEVGTLESGAPKVRATLLVLAGVRALDLSIDTQVFTPGSSTPTAVAGGDAFNAHPYGGFRGELDLYEDFTIDLVGSVGTLAIGNRESWSIDIMVGFEWNPTPHFGAQIGYRQLLFGIEKGEGDTELSWDGGLAGLYAGTTIRY